MKRTPATAWLLLALAVFAGGGACSRTVDALASPDGGAGSGGARVAAGTGGRGAGGGTAGTGTPGTGGRTGTGGAASGGAGAGTGGAGGASTITSGVACTMPSDCSSLPTPQPDIMCNTKWSCIEHACTYDCSIAPRTCALGGNGCVTCTSEPPGSGSSSCLTDSCSRRYFGTTPPRIEGASCSLPAPDPTTWTCFGTWVLLPDNTLCTMTDVATDLPRFVLTCGVCRWVYQG